MANIIAITHDQCLASTLQKRLHQSSIMRQYSSVWFVVAVCLLACSSSSPWSPLGHVSAQTVSIKIYSDPACQTFSTTATSGVPANGQCTSSKKQYCGNGQVVTYSYYDTACTQLTGIGYSPVGSCVRAGQQSNIFTCPSGATVPPITFPPADDGTWSYISTCADNACSTSCQVTSALKLGTCYTDPSMSYGRTVAACTADGAFVTGPGANLGRQVVVARRHRCPRHRDI